jgi:hypothetical protein
MIQNNSNSWNHFKYQLQRFLEDSWPIKWTMFKQPRILLRAIYEAPNPVPVIFSIASVGLLISFGFFGLGIYRSITVEASAKGGVFSEGILGDSIQRLNPVLEMGTDTEKKITSLLFHPLYTVTYPDFTSGTDNQPQITPILLEEPPQWLNQADSPQNDFTILRFKLRSGLKWSNNTPLTVNDIVYSFQRLKENGGNSNFNSLLKSWEITTSAESNLEFFIRKIDPSTPLNPQLIYLLNFSPISQEFFANKTNDDLRVDTKSLYPTVSSGYFTFAQQVTNPYSPREQSVNPQRDVLTNTISRVILTKNPINNLSNKDINLDYYVFNFTNNLSGGNTDPQGSLVNLKNNNRLDLYTRYLLPSNVSSEQIKSSLQLEQQVITTNSFFNVYINIQPTNTNLKGYFVNQTLRKYVVCNLLDYQVPASYSPFLNSLPREKRLIPIQFNQNYELDCGNIENELLAVKGTNRNSIYGIKNDESNDIKRITYFGNQFNSSGYELSMIGLKEFQEYGVSVQDKFRSMGMPVNAEWLTQEQLAQRINNKTYHFLFYPTNLVNRDVYPIYGKNSRNVSNISRNDRVKGEEIEQNLLAYSQSNLTNVDARNALIEFFKSEYIGVTLFQGKQEINYSPRIFEFAPSIPNHLTLVEDIYQSLPDWYIEKRRVMFFQDPTKN